ncbi:MAG: GLPGLI family protein [Bacteroidia bacterium]|nr:GLPGLI family protein [Bacteroidia bacterium]
MKIKLFILTALFCVICHVHLRAQFIDNNQLDVVDFRIIYQINQLASKNGKEVIITDTMALDIGNNWSVYYDWNKIRRDSIEDTAFKNNQHREFSFTFDEDALHTRLEAKNEVIGVIDASIGESMQIFKHRKNGDIITFDEGPLQDFDIFTNFKLSEKILPLNWEITKDTLTVLNYLCRKATTTFRGRTYNAWFTLDIPIGDGPWKLYGLPGLILKAEDADCIFSFEAMGLQKIKNATISFPTDKKIVPCNSLKTLYQFRENRFKDISIGFSEGNGGIIYYNTKNPVKFNLLEIEN